MKAGRHVLAALTAALAFAIATPVGKLLLGSLSGFQLAGLLYLGAAAATAIPAFRRRTRVPFTRPNKGRLAGTILFGGVLAPLLLFAGLLHAQAGSVSLWLNLEPVATAALGVLLFRDQVGPKGLAGAGLVVAASALVSYEAGQAGIQAGIFVGLAAVCWGFDNQLGSRIDALTPSQTTFWKGLVGGSVNLIFGLLAPVHASAPTIMLAFVVGMVSYGLSITLYLVAAQGLGATRSQAIFATSPFLALASSILFLHEPLSAGQAGAAILMAGAITLLLKDQHSHPHRHEKLAHTHSHRHDDSHHDHEHPGLPPSTQHTHWHEHEELTHTHPHWPDLHHRHGHG